MKSPLKKILAGTLVVFVILPLLVGNGAIRTTQTAYAAEPISGNAGATVAGTTATGGEQKINWVDCLKNPVSCGLFAMSVMANSLISLALAGGAWIAGLALDLSESATSLSMVQIGFAISLALANLGFVLGIIVIAIATILRIESYGVKQLLWKLIVMAIAINFSMVIAGSVLTFTGSLTKYFMDSASPTAGDTNDTIRFASTITAAFEPQRLFTVPDQASISGNFGTFIKSILVQFFSFVFLALITFVFYAIAAMFMVRFVFLTFLLILMPIAWLMWVFPNLHGNWEKWWHQFLRWSFFAPASTFFLYLTVAVAQNIGNDNLQQIVSNHSQTLAQTGSLVGQQSSAADAILVLTGITGGGVGIIDSALKVIILFGLAIGGLFAANAFGVHGASTAINLAKSAPGALYRGTRNVASKATGAATSRFGDRIRTVGSKSDAVTGEHSTLLQRAGSRLQGIPFMSGVGSALARQGHVPHEREEEVKKYTESELKLLTKQGFLERAQKVNLNLASPTELAAIGGEAAKRGVVSQIPPPRMKAFLAAAENTGTANKIFETRPDLAYDPAHPNKIAVPVTPANPTGYRNETQEEWGKRALKEYVKDASGLEAKVLHDPTGTIPVGVQQSIVFNLTSNKLNQLATVQQQDAVRNTVKAVWDPVKVALDRLAAADHTRLAALAQANPNDKVIQQQFAGSDPSKLSHDELVKRFSGALSPALTTDFKKVERVVRAINLNPNWQSI